MGPGDEMAATLRVCTVGLRGIDQPLERPLTLARRQLRDLAPAVVPMQEVRPRDGRAGRTTADVLAEALGMNRVYEVAVSWNAGAFGPGRPGGQEGLALLSRFPIAE